MPNLSTTRLWHVLILDRADPDDPRWLVATVGDAADVRPASPGDTAPDDLVLAWAGAATVTPMTTAKCWRVNR